MACGKFPIPVDSEYKSIFLKPWLFHNPHMAAFHLSWLSLFVTFVSTFAPAALLPVVRDDLNLTASEVALGDVAAVSGTVFCRVLMGFVCDIMGPSLGECMPSFHPAAPQRKNYESQGSSKIAPSLVTQQQASARHFCKHKRWIC